MAGGCKFFCVCGNVNLNNFPVLDEIFKFMKERKGRMRRVKEILYKISPSYSAKFYVNHVKGEINIRVIPPASKFSKELNELSKKSMPIKVKEEIERFKSFLMASIEEMKEKNVLTFFFRLNIPPWQEKKFINLNIFEKILKERKVLEIFELLEKENFETTVGMVCARYEFDWKKIEPIDVLPFPLEFPLPLEISSKLGKSRINGISIDFNDSPLGVENIKMERVEIDEKEKLVVSIRVSYNFVISRDVLNKAFKNTSEIINLLVKEVK